MKCVKFFVDTMFCGTENTEVREYPDDTPESQIECDGMDLAEDNATLYSLFIDEEDENAYNESVDYNWEYISEEEYLWYNNTAINRRKGDK
jgi:hypothetical protein